jgi:hypothetical protein
MPLSPDYTLFDGLLNDNLGIESIVTCISDYRLVLDWMIGFIDTLNEYIQHRTPGNTVLSLFYTLYSSPLYTHYGSQSSLVVSWQRIYNSLPVTSNHA